MAHRSRTKSNRQHPNRPRRRKPRIANGNQPKKQRLRILPIILRSLWILVLVVLDGIPSVEGSIKNLEELIKLILRFIK